MTPWSEVTIDCDALQHNWQRVRDLAPKASIFSVIKSNAYGHGLQTVARTLKQSEGFAVVTVDEGRLVRETGFTGAILLLGGLRDMRDLHDVITYELSPAVVSETSLALLQQCEKPLDVWVKCDVGMHRLGFKLTDIPAVVNALRKTHHRIHFMGHFPRADEPAAEQETQAQISAFEGATASYEGAKSLAHSAAVLAYPGAHYDWVRPGIMLYGISPFPDKVGRQHDLKAVMRFESCVIALRDLKAGDCVGYGGTFVCPKDLRVAIVGCGYGDGYPRHITPGTAVSVGKQLATICGRVSMNYMTVDVTDLNGVAVGTPVQLWGPDLPVEYVARQARTIPYELVCGV